jgi:YHS domain-containing protein
MIKDPVCGINLDSMAPCKSTYAGRIHVFCCSTCKSRFDKEPGRYVAVSGVVSVSYRLPSVPSRSSFPIVSSIAHFVGVVLGRSVSNQTEGRSTRLGGA